MKKSEELTNPQSCMNRAKDDEMTFVLLGRDQATPVAIRAWAAERIRLGKNQPDDSQIIDALECASQLETSDPNVTQARKDAQEFIRNHPNIPVVDISANDTEGKLRREIADLKQQLRPCIIIGPATVQKLQLGENVELENAVLIPDDTYWNKANVGAKQ